MQLFINILLREQIDKAEATFAKHKSGEGLHHFNQYIQSRITTTLVADNNTPVSLEQIANFIHSTIETLVGNTIPMSLEAKQDYFFNATDNVYEVIGMLEIDINFIVQAVHENLFVLGNNPEPIQRKNTQNIFLDEINELEIIKTLVPLFILGLPITSYEIISINKENLPVFSAVLNNLSDDTMLSALQRFQGAYFSYQGILNLFIMAIYQAAPQMDGENNCNYAIKRSDIPIFYQRLEHLLAHQPTFQSLSRETLNIFDGNGSKFSANSISIDAVNSMIIGTESSAAPAKKRPHAYIGSEDSLTNDLQTESLGTKKNKTDLISSASYDPIRTWLEENTLIPMTSTTPIATSFNMHPQEESDDKIGLICNDLGNEHNIKINEKIDEKLYIDDDSLIILREILSRLRPNTIKHAIYKFDTEPFTITMVIHLIIVNIKRVAKDHGISLNISINKSKNRINRQIINNLWLSINKNLNSMQTAHLVQRIPKKKVKDEFFYEFKFPTARLEFIPTLAPQAEAIENVPANATTIFFNHTLTQIDGDAISRIYLGFDNAITNFPVENIIDNYLYTDEYTLMTIKNVASELDDQQVAYAVSRFETHGPFSIIRVINLIVKSIEQSANELGISFDICSQDNEYSRQTFSRPKMMALYESIRSELTFKSSSRLVRRLSTKNEDSWVQYQFITEMQNGAQLSVTAQPSISSNAEGNKPHRLNAKSLKLSGKSKDIYQGFEAALTKISPSNAHEIIASINLENLFLDSETFEILKKIMDAIDNHLIGEAIKKFKTPQQFTSTQVAHLIIQCILNAAQDQNILLNISTIPTAKNKLYMTGTTLKNLLRNINQKSNCKEFDNLQKTKVSRSVIYNFKEFLNATDTLSSTPANDQRVEIPSTPIRTTPANAVRGISNAEIDNICKKFDTVLYNITIDANLGIQLSSSEKSKEMIEKIASKLTQQQIKNAMLRFNRFSARTVLNFIIKGIALAAKDIDIHFNISPIKDNPTACAFTCCSMQKLWSAIYKEFERGETGGQFKRITKQGPDALQFFERIAITDNLPSLPQHEVYDQLEMESSMLAMPAQTSLVNDTTSESNLLNISWYSPGGSTLFSPSLMALNNAQPNFGNNTENTSTNEHNQAPL